MNVVTSHPRPRTAWRLPFRGLVLTWGLLTLAPLRVHAHTDHDHSHDTPQATTAAALPRFTAVSASFELVGILDGRELTLYLDHADTNAPVRDAKLEVALGNSELALAQQGEGKYVATLAAAPAPRVIPVAAKVSIAQENELLAGKLDLRVATPPAAAAQHTHWQRWLPWGLGGLVAIVLVFLLLRPRRSRRGDAA